LYNQKLYSQDMIESIKRLEKTRNQRRKQKISPLTPQEKLDLLQKFHPDYRKDTLRELRVGPNKGDKIYCEFANLFESYSRIDPDKFNLSRVNFDVDVLVIGGGGAGASAALAAQEQGAKILLATKLRLGDANTRMAQGGIQAATKEDDSPAIHYLDFIGGGGFFNSPHLVKAAVMDAPFIIQWLERLGVMFDKKEDGEMVTIHLGGTSRKRVHSCRDYTGAEIMRTLADEVRNRRIEVIEFSPAYELLTDGKGRCTGAILYNMETQEYLIVRAKTTIIATGGAGRLHMQGFPTTNHYGATADGLVLAYRVGCRFIFLDTIQYHPTGAAFPEMVLGFLVTEKMRGLGAHLVNSCGERFINELQTRDVVAAGIIRECTERRKGVLTPTERVGVWLDSPLIEILHGSGTIRSTLPAMYRQFNRCSIDITKEPILVYPTQHYQNGGVVINDRCETEVDNLYVAGEASGGLHGRNRLAGNSLLDVLVFGRRAGENAAKKAEKINTGSLKLTLDHLRKYHDELNRANIEPKRFSPILLPDYRKR